MVARKIKVETIDGLKSETVYRLSEIPFLDILLQSKTSKKRNVSYIEVPAAFDIETTNICVRNADGSIAPEPRPYAFMYHWQFCIDKYVVFGRTWEDFKTLIDILIDRLNLNNNNRLVVWVHNLPFEFQFMRRFIHIKDGFFKEDRSPLKVLVDGGVEFRDSYALSNMTLQKFCENSEGVKHFKLSGDDYDYSKVRTPKTVLTDYEEAYCYNDVRGLCECIYDRMKSDTLASMPMTSTGYVRRDARNAMRQNKNNRRVFKQIELDSNLYTLCREAFRGGDTHANLNYVDQIVTDMDSFDITSSYPASMMIDRFPMSAFFPIKASTFINSDLSDFAQLIRVRFREIKYIGKCGNPYIPIAKCKAITANKIIDNGRVLYAEALAITLTDIDFEIICNEYTFEDISIDEVYAARYGYLSDELKSVIMEYYRAKTALKDIEDSVYEYMKSKNRLNSMFGMMCQRIDHDLTTYENGEYITQKIALEDALTKFYKSRNSFLSYQHGIWVTANSRKRLRDMLYVVGRDNVYDDTDSIKCVGDHRADFIKKNEELKEQAIQAGAYAENKDGELFYLGLWDCETEKGKYTQFKTLGAKKYIYEKNGKITSTIAGVSKKRGKEYFTKNGIDAFKIGARISDSGHLTAYYNDDDIHNITINGETFTSASNVALIDNTYTIGVTDEYIDLLQKALDNQDELFYL